MRGDSLAVVFLERRRSALGWVTWRSSVRSRASARAWRSCSRNAWLRRSPRFVEWVWLGTNLRAVDLACAGVILVGVAIALAPDRGMDVSRRTFWIGALFGVGSALGQAGGAVLSRKANEIAALTNFPIDGGTAAYQRILGGVLMTARRFRDLPPETDGRRARARRTLAGRVAAGPRQCPGRADRRCRPATSGRCAPRPAASCCPIVATSPLVTIVLSFFLDGLAADAPRGHGGAAGRGRSCCLEGCASRLGNVFDAEKIAEHLTVRRGLSPSMKTFLTRLFTACAVLAVGTSAALAAAGWDDDYEKAIAQAKAEKKMVLLDFTGSDWCGWCIKLDKEVFSKPEFKNYAKENLVLVEVDFPQGKRQTKKLKEQNEKLQQEHGVQGYPTIIVLNSEGQKVGKLGYQEGGPQAFIAKLEELKGK